MEDKFLFVHFTGEHLDGEQVYFSISDNGHEYHDLNEGLPILKSTVGEKGVRDPAIVRDEVNHKFYLIATDLQIHLGKGWEAAQDCGSTNIVVWESVDLVYWSEPRLVATGMKSAGNVWAPEAIYDQEKKAFLVFWASKVGGKHKIYGSYTTDFYTLSDPFLMLEKANDVIDSTIIEKDGVFYRFTKDETTSRILMEKSSTLTGIYEEVFSEALAGLAGVEGPEIFQVSSDIWYLIVDRFKEGLGYTILVTNDLGNKDFRRLKESEYYFGENLKRHGGILPITPEEYQRLIKYYHQKNPVIKGLWADPDLVKFGKEYYLYPTTDGFTKWSGTKFSAFKSKDLEHFTESVELLDLATKQVPWAVGSAWAPCIVEKDNRYYYYFCGQRPDKHSCIGVAVSTQPFGPYQADATPLLPHELISKYNLNLSQIIDPSIYQEAGKDYLLFGNGDTAAIVELQDDMRSIKPETIRQFEGLFGFREALEILKKDDLYHFTWSSDDAGSENYHVNYGTSKSLFGPVIYHYPILTKRSDRDIMGTGHHSIMRDSEKGEYYIAYHRHARPTNQFPIGEKGYNRETCISPLDFDVQGLMRPVII